MEVNRVNIFALFYSIYVMYAARTKKPLSIIVNAYNKCGWGGVWG
jgi:hypothetical protein